MNSTSKDEEVSKKLSELKNLSHVTPDHTHSAAFQEELDKIGNDRGYCLLIVSILENVLDTVIQAQISHFNNRQRDEFFDSHGPAGSLSRKIALVAAFEIIGPTTRRNLDFIRAIRNAFAHGKVPMTFNTKEVKNACEELQLVNPLDPHNPKVEDYTGGGPRDRFHDVVSTTTLMLGGFLGYPIPTYMGVTASIEGRPLP